MKKQDDQLGRMTDSLMSQAAALKVFGRGAGNNYMVAVSFEGGRQVNVVPIAGCEDGCTAAIKMAIEYLHKLGHKGIATDVLVCGAKFWYRPPTEFIRQMQSGRPMIVTNARNGMGQSLGERILEPVQ